MTKSTSHFVRHSRVGGNLFLCQIPPLPLSPTPLPPAGEGLNCIIRLIIRRIILAFFLLSPSIGAAETLYKVIYVFDGDTVKLRPITSSNPIDEFKLRLTDIDAPERNQDYGLKSRRALIKLCQGKNIIASTEIVAKDKYGRALGRLHCNQVDASLYLAEQGLAWYPDHYSSDFEIYNAERTARQQGRGLWADSQPIAPWHWRKNNPH
jgi:micrococcal nuclease